jgi:transposase
MSKHYPREVRERAVRLVLEHEAEYESPSAAIRQIAAKCGVGGESLRVWVRQARIDAGTRNGVTSQESAQIKTLRRENAELRRANEILRAASVFFAAELDRPPTR